MFYKVIINISENPIKKYLLHWIKYLIQRKDNKLSVFMDINFFY